MSTRSMLTPVVSATIAALIAPVALAVDRFAVGTLFAGPEGRSNWAVNTELFEFSSITSSAPTNTYYFDEGNYTRGIAVDPTRENVYALRAGPNGNHLYRFGANGTRAKFTLGTDDLPLPAGGIGKLLVAPNGNLLLPSINNTGGAGIVQITPDGKYVNTISTGGKGLWGAVWIPGTPYIYGVEGGSSAQRNDMYRIDTRNGGVTTYDLKGSSWPFTPRENASDIALLPNGNLATSHFYVNSSFPSINVWNQSGQLVKSSTTQGGWPSTMAYDKTSDRLVIAKYDEWHGLVHYNAAANPMSRITGSDFSASSPVRTEKATGGYWDIAIAGEQTYITTPPRYSQAGGTWGSNVTLNDPVGRTMAASGCFVTSTSMVLSALGHNVDPGQLNTFLQNTENLRSGYMDFGAIDPRFSYGQSNNVQGPPVAFATTAIAANATQSDIVTRIANAIAEHGPVILRVPQWGHGLNGYNDARPTNHAVVAWKVENGEIFIRDPGYVADNLATLVPGVSMDNLTLNHYVTEVNQSLSAGQQEYLLPTDLTFLQRQAITYADRVTALSVARVRGRINSPVHVLIIDENGRRLGYDENGNFINEFGDAIYRYIDTNIGWNEAPGVPAGLHVPMEFFINDVDAKTFQIVTTGTGNGAFSVEFDYTSGLDVKSQTFSGTASPGSSENFTFVVPEPSLLVLMAPALLLGRRQRNIAT